MYFYGSGNLDLNDKIIKLGKVIFYDPRKWDFGENTYFDSSDKFKITINEELSSIYKTYSNDNRKLIRNSARAMINLEAEG